MLSVLEAALVLGFVSGLRVFTAPAALYLVRGGVAGILLGIVALGEYVVDALPQAPARTNPSQVAVRIASGAFVGWTVGAPSGATLGAVAAGVAPDGAPTVQPTKAPLAMRTATCDGFVRAGACGSASTTYSPSATIPSKMPATPPRTR